MYRIEKEDEVFGNVKREAEIDNVLNQLFDFWRDVKAVIASDSCNRYHRHNNAHDAQNLLNLILVLDNVQVELLVELA